MLDFGFPANDVICRVTRAYWQCGKRGRDLAPVSCPCQTYSQSQSRSPQMRQNQTHSMRRGVDGDNAGPSSYNYHPIISARIACGVAVPAGRGCWL